MIGLLDTTRTVAVARDLGTLLDQVFAQAGFGDYTSDGVARIVGLVIVAVNVIGLVTAIALAVPRLSAHRTAFWIPLATGVACVVLTALLMVGAAVADPAFSAQVQR